MLLDTVIVIKEKVPINHTLNMTQYYKASIEPLHKKKDFFYRGYNFGENKVCFSYVPCLLKYPKNPPSTGMPTPVLNLTTLGFNVKRGWYGFVAKAIPFSKKKWDKIIDAVINQDWQIGTHIDKI